MLLKTVLFILFPLFAISQSQDYATFYLANQSSDFVLDSIHHWEFIDGTQELSAKEVYQYNEQVKLSLEQRWGRSGSPLPIEIFSETEYQYPSPLQTITTLSVNFDSNEPLELFERVTTDTKAMYPNRIATQLKENWNSYTFEWEARDSIEADIFTPEQLVLNHFSYDADVNSLALVGQTERDYDGVQLQNYSSIYSVYDQSSQDFDRTLLERLEFSEQGRLLLENRQAWDEEDGKWKVTAFQLRGNTASYPDFSLLQKTVCIGNTAPILPVDSTIYFYDNENRVSEAIAYYIDDVSLELELGIRIEYSYTEEGLLSSIKYFSDTEEQFYQRNYYYSSLVSSTTLPSEALPFKIKFENPTQALVLAIEGTDEPEPLQLTLYDQQGRQRAQRMAMTGESVPFDHLPLAKGLYFIVVAKDGKQYQSKVVIQ